MPCPHTAVKRLIIVIQGAPIPLLRMPPLSVITRHRHAGQCRLLLGIMLLIGCDRPPDSGLICHDTLPDMAAHRQTGSSLTSRDSNRYYRQLSWVYYLGNSLATPLFDPPLDLIPDTLSAAESASINIHIAQRLPRYETLFRRIAKTHQIDWRLLAAISYQESHWSPRARSPTGVRGMMMLTLTTAREVGVRNRLDVEQSVRGGARYLNRIYDRLPDTIHEPDRTWIALAAYNVGMGHVYDARDLTLQAGGDPDKWHDLRFYLLLLEQSWWYRQTRYGYARGSEPVRYVENIRLFYRHLQQPQILAQSD